MDCEIFVERKKKNVNSRTCQRFGFFFLFKRMLIACVEGDFFSMGDDEHAALLRYLPHARASVFLRLQQHVWIIR